MIYHDVKARYRIVQRVDELWRKRVSSTSCTRLARIPKNLPATVRFRMSAYRKDLRCPPKTHQSVMTMLEATKESMLPTSVGIATAGSQTPVSRTSRALRIIFKTKRNECQSGLLCKKTSGSCDCNEGTGAQWVRIRIQARSQKRKGLRDIRVLEFLNGGWPYHHGSSLSFFLVFFQNPGCRVISCDRYKWPAFSCATSCAASSSLFSPGSQEMRCRDPARRLV